MAMRMRERGEVGKHRRIKCRPLSIRTIPVLDSCGALLHKFLVTKKEKRRQKTSSVSRVTSCDNTNTA